MKAVRLHGYHQHPVVEDVPDPAIKGPLDVIVKIGGAGVCRTDLHIIDGQWDAAMAPPCPTRSVTRTPAGWHEVGVGVTNVALGDTVILHPSPTCGLCRRVPRRPRHAVREQLVPGAETATAGWPSTCSRPRAPA